jgi:hypothetical protein
MGDFLAVTFAVLLMVYVAASMVFMAVFLLEQFIDQRECAQTHNVFLCEKTVTWTPVNGGTDD